MDILSRIALHIQARRHLADAALIKSLELKQANYYLELAELLVKTIGIRTRSHQIHFQLVRMVSMAMGAVRVSLIKLGESPTVIASSDDDKFTQFALQIQKYPEIDYVQRTGRPLFIESIKNDDMMGFIKEQMKSIYFNSMVVLPIFIDGNLQGILSARMPESTHLNVADVKLCQIAAQTIGTYWQLHHSIKFDHKAA
jgi:transcriptional regulator with GAF, ATPase, and Fis domain